MVRRALLTLACVLAVILPGFAQEQTGTVAGTVKDSTGAVLPGVTVEIVSVDRGNVTVASTTTDSVGVYRFPGLRAGQVRSQGHAAELHARWRERHRPAAWPDPDGRLRPERWRHGRERSSHGGVADRRYEVERRATSIRAEQIELLPHSRDFTSLVTQAPGANRKPSRAASQSTARCRREPLHHRRHRDDHMQRPVGEEPAGRLRRRSAGKSSGYPAEYGGSTGGVINALTKSGTNNVHGTVALHWQGGRRAAPAPERGSATPTGCDSALPTPTMAEYITYPQEDENRQGAGRCARRAGLPGQDLVFGASQPAITAINRGRTPCQRVIRLRNTVEHRPGAVQYLTANAPPGRRRLRTRLAVQQQLEPDGGPAPRRCRARDTRLTNYTKGTTFPNWTHVRHRAGRRAKLVVGARSAGSSPIRMTST